MKKAANIGVKNTPLLDVLEVLVNSDPRGMQARRLARAAGMTFDVFHRRASRWIKRGYFSHEKRPGGTNAFYWYFLTDEQRERSLQSATERRRVELSAEVASIPRRLAFLRMLKEKTIYAEHQALDLIIRDYENALRTNSELEQVDESRDSHKKRVDKGSNLHKAEVR
jgi:hypothetical protein